MGRERRKWITWTFVIVTVLIVAVMLSSILRKPTRITLPPVETSGGGASGEMMGEEAALTVVEVTPKTVQAAVATLARPEEYRRTIVVEQFWNDGSASNEYIATVSGGWTRVDRQLPSGQIRHAVTNSEDTYIWYDQEMVVYKTTAGEISADYEQAIPTYEDVLGLPVETIAAADYGIVSGRRCIHIETAEDQAGYVLRYWIDLDSGLLAMAEKIQHGEIVYRMGAMELETLDDTGRKEAFTLPDGTNLLAEMTVE